MNLRWVVALQFEHGGDHFPPRFTAVNFEPVFDQFPTFGVRSRYRDEDPLIAVEAVQSIEFSVRYADDLGVFIDRFDPRLFAHGSACIIEKNLQLSGIDNCPHALKIGLETQKRSMGIFCSAGLTLRIKARQSGAAAKKVRFGALFLVEVALNQGFELEDRSCGIAAFGNQEQFAARSCRQHH